jgi:hypothetical protein
MRNSETNGCGAQVGWISGCYGCKLPMGIEERWTRIETRMRFGFGDNMAVRNLWSCDGFLVSGLDDTKVPRLRHLSWSDDDQILTEKTWGDSHHTNCNLPTLIQVRFCYWLWCDRYLCPAICTAPTYFNRYLFYIDRWWLPWNSIPRYPFGSLVINHPCMASASPVLSSLTQQVRHNQSERRMPPHRHRQALEFLQAKPQSLTGSSFRISLKISATLSYITV